MPGLIGDNEFALERAQCRPLFIGKVERSMTFYGNYTEGHFVLSNNDAVNDVVPHGQQGYAGIREEEGYDILTDCPVAKDMSGIFFTPFAAPLCGGSIFSLSWNDYLIIYNTLRKLAVLFQVRDYTFLTSINDALDNLGGICTDIITCSKTGTKAGCAPLEATLASFVSAATTAEFQAHVADVIEGALDFFDEVTTSLDANPSDSIALGDDAARYVVTVLRDDVEAFYG